MRHLSPLPETTVRAIVRLIGGVSEVQGGHAEKKRVLMNGLAEIIGADSWAWGVARDVGPGEPSVHLSLIHGGFDEETYPAFTVAYTHPDMTPLHASIVSDFRRSGGQVTPLRQQMDPEGISLMEPLGPLWEKADIDGVIMSLYPTEKNFLNVVGIYRKMGRGQFNEEENRIVHIVLSAVPWLHFEGWSDSLGPIPLLSLRQRMALDLLIQGYTRQAIADSLKISIHTANEYVKTVFRHFGVHSQPELIARFRIGDQGDQSLSA